MFATRTENQKETGTPNNEKIPTVWRSSDRNMFFGFVFRIFGLDLQTTNNSALKDMTGKDDIGIMMYPW